MREAQRILRSRAEAEDAVQEAFALAWRSRASCRSPRAPLPWLLQITRHEALRIRKQGRRTSPFPDSVPEVVEEDPQVTDTPERIDINRVLASLSREDRTLLELRYRDDMTQPGMAAVLGIPEGTVKVRLHRLRSRLRVDLEGQL